MCIVYVCLFVKLLVCVKKKLALFTTNQMLQIYFEFCIPVKKHFLSFHMFTLIASPHTEIVQIKSFQKIN